MDRDTALAKVKKCLALSKSAEPHEAAAALRQAQKLMREFGLDAHDVELAEVGESRVRATSNLHPLWQVQLVDLVADAFGCHAIMGRDAVFCSHRSIRRVTDAIFIGIAPRHDLAAYAFQVLQRQCVRARQAHIQHQPKGCKPATKTARGDLFALGWVHGVEALVERFADADHQHEPLLEAYTQRHYPNTTEFEPLRRDVGRNVRDDFHAGRVAGMAAKLHHGVGAGQAPERLK